MSWVQAAVFSSSLNEVNSDQCCWMTWMLEEELWNNRQSDSTGVTLRVSHTVYPLISLCHCFSLLLRGKLLCLDWYWQEIRSKLWAEEIIQTSSANSMCLSSDRQPADRVKKVNLEDVWLRNDLSVKSCEDIIYCAVFTCVCIMFIVALYVAHFMKHTLQRLHVHLQINIQPWTRFTGRFYTVAHMYRAALHHEQKCVCIWKWSVWFMETSNQQISL